jgi:hypothetical protein
MRDDGSVRAFDEEGIEMVLGYCGPRGLEAVLRDAPEGCWFSVRRPGGGYVRVTREEFEAAARREERGVDG